MSYNAFHGVRVFLIDDHQAVRQGLSVLLEQKGFAICGEAKNKEQTLRYFEVDSADLALVDLSLRNESGLDLISELRVRGVKTLVYSMHDDARHVEAAFAAGALGYVTKCEMEDTLLNAIEEVLSGRRFVSPLAAEKMLDRDDRMQTSSLTRRESGIFQRLGEGDSTSEIAERFNISINTVLTYYTRIAEKLGLGGTKELRRQAIKYFKN